MDDIDMDHVSDLMAFVDITSVSRQIYHLIRRLVITGPIRRSFCFLGPASNWAWLNQKSAGNTLTYYQSTITEGRFYFRSKKGLKIFIFKSNWRATFEDGYLWTFWTGSKFLKTSRITAKAHVLKGKMIRIHAKANMISFNKPPPLFLASFFFLIQ